MSVPHECIPFLAVVLGVRELYFILNIVFLASTVTSGNI